LAASAETADVTIWVPSAPANAYNPGRNMGVLLQDHIQELSRLEQNLPADQRTGIDVSKLKTEAEASNYIGQVTPRIRAQAMKGKQQ
jgi:hypothetical protein